jgi:hypothetical protein
MSRLDELNSDPDVDSAITNLTEMVAASFFTEMDEDVQKVIDPTTGKEKPHPNKVKLDAWAEKHRLDENLKMAVREAFEKGFFVIDLDPDDDFEPKVLPSESMFMWRKVDEKSLINLPKSSAGKLWAHGKERTSTALFGGLTKSHRLIPTVKHWRSASRTS